MSKLSEIRTLLGKARKTFSMPEALDPQYKAALATLTKEVVAAAGEKPVGVYNEFGDYYGKKIIVPVESYKKAASAFLKSEKPTKIEGVTDSSGKPLRHGAVLGVWDTEEEGPQLGISSMGV